MLLTPQMNTRKQLSYFHELIETEISVIAGTQQVLSLLS